LRRRAAAGKLVRGMSLVPLLALIALQAPVPAPALPTLARELRNAELVAYGRVLRLEPHALETAESRPVYVSHGTKLPRLAEVEILGVLKGDTTTKKLWLLAQPDYLSYDLDLGEAGAQALFFLTRGEDPAPEGCTYIAKTQDTVWRCSLGRSGFAPFADEGGARAILAPGWRFEAGDGALAALPKGADGRVARVEAKALEARIQSLAEEQHATWITVSASGGMDEFAWELALRYDRSATLTIQRAQGPEPHEIWITNPIMEDIALKLATDPPADAKLELGVAKARGLVRSVQVHGGVELRLLTLEREWMDDPAHKQLARWALQLYSSVRSGIREPGMLDGRRDDRDWLR
jgi:hypothetical protein